MTDTRRYEFDLQSVLRELNINGNVSPTTISRAVATEAKTNRNYANAEQLYQLLVDALKKKEENKPGYRYSELDVLAMQRALGTLVRYAPSADKAQYFFGVALKDWERPFRNCGFEVNLLNNLLYIYTNSGERYYQDAKRLIEVALQIRVFQCPISRGYAEQNRCFNNPKEVFETLCRKVLKYYRLEFNDNKTALRPSTRQFSH